MTDDADLPLDAWDAPPPPAGLADAVIARMREPATESPLVSPAQRRTRWWLAAGIAASVAATLAIVVVIARTSSESEEPSSGTIATSKPSHVAVGGSSVADLEANTDLRWAREGDRIVVAQPRGTSTWKIGANDTVVIDAGATVASVVASGASLRVEVVMNVFDARTMSVSAITAAAVAMVTVIVYEGHVRVTGTDKTVTLAAGQTISVRPPDVVAKKASLDQVDLAIEELQKAIELNPLDNAAIERVMVGLRPKIRGCARDPFSGVVHVTFQIFEDGSVSSIDATLTTDDDEVVDIDPKVAQCIAGVLTDARFPKAAAKSTVTFPMTFVATACDTAALVREGDRAMAQGTFRAALASYEAAIACGRAVNLEPKAYLAACRAREFPRARAHFVKLPTARQEGLAQICITQGYDPRAPATPPVCNPQLIHEAESRGDTLNANGAFSDAIAALVPAMTCKPQLGWKAYLFACRGHLVEEARKYFKSIPATRQNMLSQICLREGIDPRK
ncbi:MAG: hypothetical protein ABI867_14295 [Kofleriaceae bacterium]